VIDSSIPAEPLNLQIVFGGKTWGFGSYLRLKRRVVQVLLTEEEREKSGGMPSLDRLFSAREPYH